MSMPWFRLYAEFASDPVVQSLAFEDQRHFVVVLCLKCNGTLDRPMDERVRDRIIYRGLGLDPKTAEEAKRRLLEVGVIDEDWQPMGWEKRQFASDNSTQRVRNHRKNKEAGNVTETPAGCSGNGPDTDTDTDQIPPMVPPAGDGFAIFWDSYPAKFSKGSAERAWRSLSPNEQLQAAIMAGLERAKTSARWQERGGPRNEVGYRIPYPGKWLRSRGWLDEHGPAKLPSRRAEAPTTPPPDPLTAEQREAGSAAARAARQALTGKRGAA